MRIYTAVFLSLCIGSQASFANVLVGESGHRAPIALTLAIAVYKLPIASLRSHWSGKESSTSDTTVAASPSGQKTSGGTVNCRTPSNSAKTCGQESGGDGKPPRKPSCDDDQEQDFGTLGRNEKNPYLAQARAYAQAAAGGDGSAMRRLGDLCAQGHLDNTNFVGTDDSRYDVAALYFIQAIEHGDTESTRKLFELLKSGAVKDKDRYALAVNCFKNIDAPPIRMIIAQIVLKELLLKTTVIGHI